MDCAQASLDAQRALKEDEVSLYVGIPFCPTRCAYCSFVSADVGRTLKLLEPYLDALLEEIGALGRVLERTGRGFAPSIWGRYAHHPVRPASWTAARPVPGGPAAGGLY